MLFLSTPSGWRATQIKQTAIGKPKISIHALRVEGDGTKLLSLKDVNDFYPRPPGGGRPEQSDAGGGRITFLSTPSGWRATVGLVKRSHDVKISIHALRVEGDEFLFGHGRVVLISIHALRVEGDESSIPSCGRMSKFLSTPSGWRATGILGRRTNNRLQFLSTPSGWRATSILRLMLPRV